MKKVLLAILFTLTIISCRRIPLYDAESGVYIKIKIDTQANLDLQEDIVKNLPQKYLDKIYGRLPEKMQVNFYDVETHDLVYKEFIGPEGGYVDISPGVYDIIIFSIDNDYTRVDKMESRGSIYALTGQNGSRLLTLTKGDAMLEPMEFPVIKEPDHLYVAKKESVIIPEHSVVDETIEIYFSASTIIDTYIFKATNVKNIQNVKSVEVCFSGQASCKHLWDRRFNQNDALISVDCYADVKNNELITVFNTFGKLPNNYNFVFLSINNPGNNAEGREFVFDVTDQFDNPDNTAHLIIVSDEIDVPAPGSGYGGFEPDITDWDEEHRDIDI